MSWVENNAGYMQEARVGDPSLLLAGHSLIRFLFVDGRAGAITVYGLPVMAGCLEAMGYGLPVMVGCLEVMGYSLPVMVGCLEVMGYGLPVMAGCLEAMGYGLPVIICVNLGVV